MRKIKLLLFTIPLIPHLLVFNFHKNKNIIRYDTKRWLEIYNLDRNIQKGFLELMRILPEYRNLFYKRMGAHQNMINWLCPQMESLLIRTNDIGPGLIIRHGLSTTIDAKTIGKDCMIYRHVSTAFSTDNDNPVIGDDVTILCGAILIGGIKIGDNAIIGAGAVVVKDVPENSLFVGKSRNVIKNRGVKLEESF